MQRFTTRNEATLKMFSKFMPDYICYTLQLANNISMLSKVGLHIIFCVGS